MHLVERMYGGGTLHLLRSRRVDEPDVIDGKHFLDQYTGDFYKFDKETVVHGQKGVWVPFANAGIRLRRAMGKRIRNVFRVDPVNGIT